MDPSNLHPWVVIEAYAHPRKLSLFECDYWYESGYSTFVEIAQHKNVNCLKIRIFSQFSYYKQSCISQSDFEIKGD